MKKVTLLVVMLAFLANVSMAQNKERVNAYNYDRNAKGYITTAEQFTKQNRADKAQKQMGFAKIELSKAKASIDLAAAHEETKNEAKTWHYYGIVYYKIAFYPEFNDLDPDALNKSFEAFAKIPAMDPNYANDRQNMYDIYQHIQSITSIYYDKGAVAYNNGEYKDAIEYYKSAYNSMLVIGQKDNEALMNAAQSAIKADEYNKAVELCEVLFNNAYESAGVYQYMVIAQRGLENNDEMLRYINEGRAKFPEDKNLIDEQINTYLTLKREVEIIDQLKEMADKNKENPVYCLITGTIYSNQESELYNVDSALVYYNRVIEITPNNENAYINIGSMYIDKAAALYNEANGITGVDPASLKKYDALVAEAKSFDEKALPYVEKAYELLPNDDAIKQALRTLYVRLKMMDKAELLKN